MARKHNYLNNKDLLSEIHKSKNTYCVYRDPENDHDFDLILNSVDDITGHGVSVGSEVHPEAVWHTTITKKIKRKCKNTTKYVVVLEHGTYAANPDEYLAVTAEVGQTLSIVPNLRIAKDNRAKRLAKRRYDAAIKDGQKVKQAEFAIDPLAIADEELIFRINEFEHIPWAKPKKTKAKPKRKKIVESNLVTSESEEEVAPDRKHIKTNFPPFYHWRYVDGILTQVGKSHWKGHYANGAFEGEFSTKHGYMTEKLALMFMKLCERYATKGNWRGYTYNDEMRGQALLQLSTVGLQFNEAESQNPFAYYTAIVNNAFTRVLNIEKKNQVIRDDILEANDLTPSYTRQNENDMAMMADREAMHQKANELAENE